MVKAAKEIQMENPKEAETPSTGATCSPPEEQAEKPSMLCFKKRKKPCKMGMTVKDTCEGASEEKSQCVNADQGEMKVSSPSQSSKGAWAAIKNLARPRRRQKSSSRKKVSSDSQVQLEVDVEEGSTQDLTKKRASSGVKMPCVRFSRGKKKPSPSKAVEESEASVQANEVMGVSNKASEQPEDLAPKDQAESFSPVSAEGQDTVKEDQDTVSENKDAVKEDQDTVSENKDAVKEDQDTVSENKDAVKEDQDTVKEDQDTVSENKDAVKEDQDTVKEDQDTVSENKDAVKEDQDTVSENKDAVKEDQDIVRQDQDTVKEDQDTVRQDQDTVKESDSSVGKSEPLMEPTPDVEEHTECTIQSEITDSETVNETAQDKLQEGSLPQTTDDAEDREVAPKASPSKDQPNSAPETTKLQEIPNICKELPEGGESEKNINLPEECKAEETLTHLCELSSRDDEASVQECSSYQVASRDDGVSVQECSSHQVTLEANSGAGVSIVITITEAEDSDNTDSDQAYEPSPVLHQNKQKGNKKSNRNADVGKKEGPEAGGSPPAEEKGLGDQGQRTGEQYELLLIETASSLVKAAIQSSIEQLVNEMALEQNKHNSFL